MGKLSELWHRIKNTIFGSIRRKMVITFLVLIVIPVMVSGVFSYVILQNIVKEKAGLGNTMALSQAAISLERIFRDMILASNNLLVDNDIQRVVISEKTSDTTELYLRNDKVQNRFKEIGMLLLDDYAGNEIIIRDRNGTIYSTMLGSNFDSEIIDEDKINENFFKNKELPSDSNFVKWGELSIKLNYLGKTNYVVLSRAYVNYSSGVANGDIAVCMPNSCFVRILRGLELSPGIKSYIINDQSEIMCSTDYKLIGNKFSYFSSIKGKKTGNVNTVYVKSNNVYVNYKQLRNPKWSIVQVIPDKVLFSEVIGIRNIILLINGCAILVFLFISYLIARSISKPISILTVAAKDISEGKLMTRVGYGGIDEVGVLSRTFNTMAERIQNLIKQANEDEKKKKELELQMLYAQINPHFLFNTLNSVRWMAEACKAANISRVVVALTKLLHNSILKKNEFITIREEIENVRSYIFIQKVRYNSVFEDIYEVSEEIMEYKTLKFILQPIVENSIIHGFKGMDTSGVLHIKGDRDGSRVKLVISDNGRGIPEDRLEQIMSGLHKNSDNFNGIGVDNVNSRLILNFGNEFGLKISSSEGVGTTTEVYLPIIAPEG